MQTKRQQVTTILGEIREGQGDGWEKLLPLVYDELQAIARAQLSRLRPGDTLRTTDLVHESYLRLLGRSASFENRRHFFGATSRAMRDILVEQARHRSRKKRGGDWDRVALADDVLADDSRALDLLALDEVLRRLEREDEQQHQVVMLRYFGGLSIDEVAELLEVSPSTVDRAWRFARAWLRRELSGG